jgi:hypothetical protein
MVYLYFQGDEISIGPMYREGGTRVAVVFGAIWVTRLEASGDDRREEFLYGVVEGITFKLFKDGYGF